MSFFKKLKNMFYGLDELGKFLFIIWAVLCVLGNITKNRTLIMLDTVVIIYALFRMTSPNKSKRYYENQKYKNLFKNINLKTKQFQARMKDTKNNYYRCPNCKQLLSVPKGVGKVMIVCNVCKTQFVKKSK